VTSRELVLKTLEFENKDSRAPRQLWTLPWAGQHYPEELKAIEADYPSDFGGPPVKLREQSAGHGDPYVVGEYVDDWGCRFVNLQKGVHGQVKDPIVSGEDEDWEDLSRVHIPTEWLSFDTEEVDRYCASTDKFVIAGCCPRPFEQLQFIRGTENLLMDLALKPAGLTRFIGRMHQFYCELLEKWAKTKVDALSYMDDWGTQKNLLVSPDTWVAIFKPLYKDYIDIAHRNGKKIFMHSDGHTLAIYPYLVELGLDAFNSQIFCMGVENLAPFKGKITFWGEMDRQHLLPSGTTADIRGAVRQVYDTLWKDGGCIAQCEFGAGAKPENVRAMFAAWDEFTQIRDDG
jgi:uroporphyrinogen-III decarboxylase